MDKSQTGSNRLKKENQGGKNIVPSKTDCFGYLQFKVEFLIKDIQNYAWNQRVSGKAGERTEVGIRKPESK